MMFKYCYDKLFVIAPACVFLTLMIIALPIFLVTHTQGLYNIPIALLVNPSHCVYYSVLGSYFIIR